MFGGSFNPVHAGHFAVACGALDSGMVDFVWFMPCRQNPLKAEPPRFSDSERIEMLSNILENGDDAMGFLTPSHRNKMKITDVDFRLPSPSYTWKSLEVLARENPECDFTLIMGADSYLDFKNWKNPDWIRENFGLIIYPRPGYEIKELEENCRLLRDVKEFDISSTEIRKTKYHGKY